MNCVVLKNLYAGYNGDSAIIDVSFMVPTGVRCAVVGPNGAGKTTLLKAMLNIIDSQKGNVSFWDKEYGEVRSKIAYVPQRKVVDWSFPITVYDAVLMGAYSLSCSLFSRVSQSVQESVEEALRRMGLIDFKYAHINDLSGGQQQRVFIARALVQQANLYILDEPLTGLDKISEKTITDVFGSLKTQGKTIIAVHHDWSTLGLYFDWVIFLNKKLFYCGPYDYDKMTQLFNSAF